MNYAVIGANYGDEGKGLITDYLARTIPNNIVCRFNGGPQAAHTVVDNDARHVFHHVGSGTLAGSPTYLESKFLVHPFLLSKEIDELEKVHKITPKMFCNPNCEIITSFDIAINQLKEIFRGSFRHGSCGVGINETVTRNDHGYHFKVKDLLDPTVSIRDLLYHTYDFYWKTIVESFDLTNIDDKEYYKNLMNLDSEIKMFEYYRENTPLIIEKPEYSNWIYEGAQGLGLDEELGTFPHVTRSKTGLINIIEALDNNSEITPIYVTRTYMTRHGDGPFQYSPLNHVIEDLTNKPNEFQGSMVMGKLDLHGVSSRVKKDLLRVRDLANSKNIKINPPQLAITWMDEYFELGYSNKDDFINSIEKLHGLKVKYLSYGPSAKDVTER